MTKRGFSTNILLVIFGVVVIAGVFVYSNLNPSTSESISKVTPTEEKASLDSVVSEAKPIVEKTAVESPKPHAPVKPSIPQPTLNPTAPSSSDPVTSTPPTAPAPVSQVPYSPNFQAATRVTPEIPSENERAKLPSCEGKKFSYEPLNLGGVSSISSGSFVGNSVSDYTVFTLIGKGEFNKYDFIAPDDVYITHITQENGISADPEDSTIYFALCKDVVGYVTHVKELSTAMHKLVTDSVCFGKPHTGANACEIKVFELISRGSLLGKVGRFEGKFGFGVIDLRHDRGLPNAAQYPIKTNFAVCPFLYFVQSSGYFAKLSGSNDLCSVP